MEYFLTCLCIFRIILPILLTVCLLRPSLFSAIYLLLFFVLPFIPTPSAKSMRGHTGIYLKLLLSSCVLITLAKIAFKLYLIWKPEIAKLIKDSETLEKVLRHIGLVRLDGISPVAAVIWTTPEVTMFLSSIIIYMTCKKLTRSDLELGAEHGRTFIPKTRLKEPWQDAAVSVGKYVCLTLLCVAASLKPSVQGCLYFLVFISASTWWSCYKELQRGFAIVLRCLMVVIAIHISVFYAYQFQWTQELIEINSTYTRYFGLTRLVTVNTNKGSDPRDFYWAPWEWDIYMNPIVLLWLYYILGTESKHLLMPQFQKRKVRTGEHHRPHAGHQHKSDPKDGLKRGYGSEDLLLIRSGTLERREKSKILKKEPHVPSFVANVSNAFEVAIIKPTTVSSEGRNKTKEERRRGFFQRIKDLSSSKKYGSVTKQSFSEVRDLAGKSGVAEEEEKPTFFGILFHEVKFLVQRMVRSSYIVTNIIMMAWSISYHSWITFVLLLWANILWMVPNQRIAMFRCTPYLVVYGLFLLITGYIFSLDLNDNELPEKVGGFDLAPIGFEKNKILPWRSLLIKCLYMSMFWINMRQYMMRKQEEERRSSVEVVSTKGKKRNKIMEIIGPHAKRFLSKFWIWIVAYMLFVVAMTGSQMNGFRITYMALFLIFMLSYQLSFRIWRNMMLTFWLIVISYSMIALVLVYTYQFKTIRQFWTVYLHVPKTQQLDIGLEVYEPRQLFIRLFSTTVFIILTAIQLQYFHKDFMEITKPKSKGHMHKTQLKETTHSWWKEAQNIKNLIYLFLELHLPKIVLLLAMMMCIYDKCAMYLAIVILITASCGMGRPTYLFAIYTTSVLVSLMILARMVYQIQYIRHETWDVKCPRLDSPEETDVYNNAEWLGFRKLEKGETLPHLIKWNTVYILAVTLWSVVSVRQNNYREGKANSIPNFMFPKIRRSDADKNLNKCLKYLLNYGYYRFGLEICLIALVATIAFRIDMYSFFYGIWLCLFLVLSRRIVSKLWNFFFFFIVNVIPFQYIMLIGFAPNTCIGSAHSEVQIRFREWAYLMNPRDPLPGGKILFDFILLLFVSRQAIAFRTEHRNAGKHYAGGSNEKVIHHFEEENFVNPVPDFITYFRSYLDIVKRTFFLGFIWITLTIVFLNGTHKVSVFSSGYLIESFLLLWQGSDLYLRPIRKILRSVNFLLAYNVAVILIKTVSKFVICVYMPFFKELDLCWFIQVMAVGCRKISDTKGVTRTDGNPPVPREDQCRVPKDYNVLLWDGVCCGFLIILRRILNSYNFFHVINETKANTILASRGAEVLQELTEKRKREYKESERRIFEKIKVKSDKIKANQQKLRGTNFQDMTNHYDAVRAGDYYMFEDDDDDDEEELELITEQHSSEEELEEEMAKSVTRIPTLSQLITAAIKTNISTTVKSSDTEIRRISSMPLPARRHSKSVERKSGGDERQSGISRDDESSESSEPMEYTKCQKLVDFLLFVWACLQSAMLGLAKWLNKYSREYRYVLSVLNNDKKILKEKTDYDTGLRLGRAQKWQPVESYHTLIKQAHKVSYKVAPNVLDDYEDQEKGEMSSVDQPPIIRLLVAIWNVVLANTDMVCYLMIFLNQMKSATFLSLPLSMMVFLWGTLSIPRPSKTFWVVIVAYTELNVLVKSIFQFEILSWNRSENLQPFFPPRIIGIERRDDYALWDVCLLIVVFFHRLVLKSIGLWKSDYLPAVVLADGEYKIKRGELEASKRDPDVIQRDLTLVSYPARLGGGRRDSLERSYDISITKRPYELQKHRRISKFLPSYTRTALKYRIALTADRSGAIIPSKAICVRRESDPKQLVEETEESEDEEQKDNDSMDLENQIVLIQTEQVDPSFRYSAAFSLGIARYANSIKTFFKQLVNPESKVGADVYSFMFLCDFFNLFIIIIGFSAFSPSQGDGEYVSSYLEEDRVPMLFLLMLVLHFFGLIIDRAIYLRKNIVGKIVFQYMQIVLLHTWLFIVYPLNTERGFNSVLPPQMYYVVKCFYLLLSAYQIRSGYPTIIFTKFMCKGYNYLNLFLFHTYMGTPFLFELRTIMDWMWTDTSMSIFSWVKMEDIFAHVFVLKCTRYVETILPFPRGMKRPLLPKYFIGGSALIVLIALIWFPLVIFSLNNAVGSFNIPFDVTIDLRIGPYQPIYQMSGQSNAIFQFNDEDKKKLLKVYERNKLALTFLSYYKGGDIAAVVFSTDSAMVWSITPPDRLRMIKEINSTRDITIHFQYQISHRSSTKQDSGIIREEINIALTAIKNGKRNPARDNLLKMLSTEEEVPSVVFQYIFPKFVKVTKKGRAMPVTNLMDNYHKYQNDKTLRNLTVNRKANESDTEEWWEVKEQCDDKNFNNYLKNLPYADPNCDTIVMYTFSDKMFPAYLSVFTSGGIIGAYMLYFFVVFRVMRSFIKNKMEVAWYEDTPNVDRVYALLNDVYTVRQFGHFELEEDLFAKLMFACRSRELYIHLVRPFGYVPTQGAVYPYRRNKSATEKEKTE